MEKDSRKFNSKIKKSILGSLILFLFVFQIFLFLPKPAEALFGVGDITFSTTIGDIPRLIWDNITKITKQVMTVAYKNALRTFTQQIAYNTAVKIASGGAGQGPLFTTDEFLTYAKKAGDAAVGDLLDTMSTRAWGFSLCDAVPQFQIDLQLNLAIDLGISEPRQAKCTGSEILNNLANAQPIQVTGGLGIGIAGQDPAMVSSALMKSFPDFFSPEGNNMGQYLKTFSVASESQARAEEKAKEEAKPPGEFLPLKSTITGKTKTPAGTIEEVQAFSLEQAINPENTFTGELAADFIGVFTNTLIKKYLETLLTKGLNPEADTSSGNLDSFLAGGGSSGIAAAEAKFASFTQPNLGGGGSVDILNKLSSCPSQYSETENCVMDSNFRTAVEQHLRLEEAIEKGYVDGNKPFGYGQGGSLLDYQNGYPYRSLVIMRRHRIVPVTWELAAQYIRDYGAGNYSLNDLMSKYNDETSPFYRLIDPDWVLKAPENYCRRQGYGEGLVFDEYFDSDGDNATQKVRQVQRQNTCVDDQSCIAENEDGTCQAYGYCIKEDPIWKFSGDQCPDYYASCKTYQRRDGQQFSYLEDTVDFNGCTADNVGCQWYCKEFDESNERWDCYWDGDDYGYFGAANPWGISAPNGNQWHDWIAHLDAGAETCDSSAEGCHEFLRTTNQTNLIKNANFDYFTGTADDGIGDAVNSWDSILTTPVVLPEIITIQTTSPYLGYNAVRLVAGTPEDDGIVYNHYSTRPVDGRTFTFSVYAKADSASCADDAFIKLYTTNEENPLIPIEEDAVTLSLGGISGNWQRYELNQTFSHDYDYVEVYLGVDNGCNLFFDAAKLEEKLLGESTTASEFVDYGSINKLYLTGERASCEDEDVGCQWYTPVEEGDSVPAKISADDMCLETEVGCKAYEETPLTNIIPDPSNVNRTGKYCSLNQTIACNNDADCQPLNGYCYPSISLIASTGTQCSATYAGCEEFTNLDEVAKGGEGKEYYTFLKQCVPLDDPSITTYYAWEGDEVAGYQLRAFKLKRSGIVLGGETGNAPCTHLEVGQSLPLDCQDTPANVQECSSEYGTDPDCTEFFDASMHDFYRYKSQTITVSDSCHPERNSLDNQVYYGLPSESTSCPASANGCREYLGNAGYNYQEIFDDNFEDGTTQGWEPRLSGAVELSTESVLLNGHSLKITGHGRKWTTINGENQLEDGKTYLLSFWAKSGAGVEVHPDILFSWAYMGTGFADNDPASQPPQITLSPDEWRYYTLGPLHIDLSDNSRWVGTLPDELMIINIGGNAYFDNVILTETTDNTYLIRNSATICTGAENCAAYTDINSQTFYLKSFTKLCDEEVAGCEEMIDTRNTSNPYNEAFGTEIPSGIPTGSDYGSNYVNNPEIYCDASDRGCRALGKPVIAPDDSDPDELDSIADYETIYLKDDAERYSAIWCDASEVGCEQYNFSGGLGTAYFQDPGAKTCEYKQQAGSLVYDWYKTGTEEECPTTAVPDPAPFIPTNDWAGLCTSQYDGCTAYRDPMDPVECNPEYPYEVDETNSPIMRGTSPGCETYYYISSSVDQNSCNGTVDEQKGCKLFNNTDDPTDVFTADLSPDGQEKYCDNSDPDYYGDLCTTDSDCGTGTCLENAQTGPPAVCSEGICIGGTNPGDACTAAGGECQGGACSLFTPIDSGYCDSNSVIKVERDRECEEWLYCKTSLEVDDPDDNDGDGQTKEQVCYEIGACNGIGPGGQCNSFVGESPVNVIGDTAGFDFDEFQNYSGFVSAGLMYGCNQSICLGGTNDYTSCSTDAECTGNGVCTAGASISCTVATEDSDCGAGNHCEIIEGLYPYSEMYEVGMGGATSVNDLINFGDFESDPNGNFLVCDSSNDKSKNPCIADSECVSGDPPVNGQCNNGSLLPAWAAIDNGTVQVVENDSTIMGNEALDENNFLKFEPDQASTSTGVKGEMDSGSILNDQEYSLTLEAGFLGEFGSSADIIQATFAQIDGNGQVLWEEPIGEIPATLGFQQYILDPYTVQNIPNENEKSYLLLKPQGPYCVGGSNAGTACPIGNECQGGGSCQIQLVKIPFKVDNVSLKPVLAVQSANTNGLRGDYYDLVWQDVGDPGLNEECFADGNLTDPSTCPGNPYLAPRINWYAACVYCNPPGAQQYCDHCGNGDTVVSSDEMDPYVPIQSTQDIFESASSARWTGGIYFDQSDDYVLFFNIDDGFRVWIDDMSTPVFSKWSTVPVQGYYVEKDFEAGWHPIKVEWNNTIGSGGPQMGWFKEPDTGWSGGATNFSPAADCDGSPLGDWCEDYCISTTSCSGDFHTQIPNDKLIPQTKLTTSISKEFGNYHSTLYSNYLDFGDFLPTLQTQANTQEMAAVRWNGQVLADTTGDYTFWFDVNDGLKFYLDDLNTDVFGGAQWIDGDREVSHTATGLSAGWHNIKIEYYQNESAATMRFGWDPPSGGKVYPIPANHLANAGIPDYKARSCRAYPRDDSLACNYVDDDLVSFNGWQGYCIETDPTNPDRCVTWWPVDIISGESSVFGTIDPAGYQGKTPLYYCAESTSRFVGDQGLSGSGTSWPYGARYSGICNCIGFPPTCTAPPNDGYIPETPYCTVYDITNEYTPDGDNANVFLESSYWWYWDPDDSDCDDLEAEGYDLVTAYNQSPSIAKPWGLYGGCAAHTILDGIFPFSPSLASFYEDEVEKVVIEVIDRSHAGDWPNAGTQWELDRSNGWHMGWNEGSCSNSNCLVVTANLDANGKFSTWDWTLMDGSEYDGGMFLKVMIYLRQSCIDVVKVVDYTENKAWASRTSEGSSYVVPDLGYRYEGSSHPDDLPYPEPFGAVVAAPSDPDVDRSGWDSRGSPEGGYQPPYIEDKDDTPAGGPPSPNYQVRAGLPYACGPNYGINSNECGSKFCVGGKDASGNSLDGHSCANDTDCGSDSSDRGFCQGVGTCSDTLRTCRVDADCPNISGNEICIGAAAGSKDLNWSVDRLKRLFAKPYGLWGWNWNQGIFESDFSAVSQWVTAYNSMPACWGTGVGPRPAFNASTDADYCGIYPTVYNIKVNGAENNVTFASGGVANLTFNSMVDPDQQPLVDFTIDWGDDTNPPSINWGGAPKTDPAEPHLVSHTYTCVAGDIGWNPAMNRCEFPIEIMARDNWEFCNVNGRNCAIDTYNYDFFGGATGRVYVTP